MALQIASNLVPSGGGTFYLLEDTYLKGGFSVYDNVAARDAIALSNLKVGQLVLTVDDSKIWKVTELVLQTRENPDVEEKAVWEEFLTGAGASGGFEDAPEDGKTYGRQNKKWVEVTAGGADPTVQPTPRKVVVHTLPELVTGGLEDFVLELAVSCIVLKLELSRPAMVSAYSSVARDESNPYQFKATEDHLTDDGSMLLADGTVFRSRNFSILANMEVVPSNNIYFRLESVDDASGPVVLTITYLPLETLPPTEEPTEETPPEETPTTGA